MTLAAGSFCLIFAFLSKFKRFKGLGIEAELWEQKQEEAAALVETLRSLSLLVAEQLVSISARMSKWDSATKRQDFFALVERLKEILDEVNVPAGKLEVVKADFYRSPTIEMARPIILAINDAIKKKIDEQGKLLQVIPQPIQDIEKYNKERNRIQATKDQQFDWNRLKSINDDDSSKELKRLIENAYCLTQDERKELQDSLAEEIKDLHEWVSKRKLRRPEHWFGGDL